MSYFPSDGHLASWAALCPGNNESAGKHRSWKTRGGNQWLRTALVEAAWAATRVEKSALAVRYRRVMRHRGHQKALIAVAHAILRAVYHLLAEGTPRTVSLAPTTTTVVTLTGSGGARSNCSNARDTA